MKLEWRYSPYQSEEVEKYDQSSSGVQERSTLVYIRNFTGTRHDFAYYIHGSQNMSKFHGRIHGAFNYKEPVFATPIVLLGAELNRDDATTLSAIDWRHFEKVPKRGNRFAEAKWRYMFETARRAWSKMVFDPVALQALEKMMTNITAFEWSSEEEERPEAISAGRQIPEGQNIAIEQTLALLMKRNDHYDKVYEFLEAELDGRRRRQKRSDFTVKQQHLIARLRDNADDLKTLYEDEEEDGSFDVDLDDKLIADRGKLIQQILEELAQAIGIRDDAKPEKTSSSGQEDNTTDPTSHSKEDLNKVEQFQDFTGTDFDHNKALLLSTDWNLDAALGHHFNEQQEATKPTSTDTDPEAEVQNEAVKRFVDVTHPQFPIAKYYLVDASWNESLAADKFFNDTGVTVTASKLIHPTPSAMPPPTDAVSDKPTTYIPVSTGSEKSVGVQEILENIVVRLDRIEKIKAAAAQESVSLTTGNPEQDRKAVSELMQLSGVPPEIAKYYLMHNDWNMPQAISRFLEEIQAAENAESGEDEIRLDTPTKYPTRETRLNSAPSSQKNTDTFSKPMITNGTNLESQQTTVQRGFSHTGLPITVDVAGNFVAHRGIISGTPYEQYQAMRHRLRVKYYGYEAEMPGTDPHRGIPIRERCADPPLVQEIVSDFSSEFSSKPDSDENGIIEIPDAMLTTPEDLDEWDKLTDDQKAAVHAERARVQAIADSTAAKEAAEIAQILAVVEEAERREAEEIADAADKKAKATDSTSSSMASLPPPSDPPTPNLAPDHSSDKKSKASCADLYGLGSLPPTLAMLPPDPARSGSSDNIKKLTLKLRMNLGDPNSKNSNTSKDEQAVSPVRSPTPEEAKVSEEDRVLGKEGQKKKDEQFAMDRERNLLEAEKREEEEEKKKKKKKRALFVSEQDDAWDGLDDDEVDVDLGLDGDENDGGDGENGPMISDLDNYKDDEGGKEPTSDGEMVIDTKIGTATDEEGNEDSAMGKTKDSTAEDEDAEMTVDSKATPNTETHTAQVDGEQNDSFDPKGTPDAEPPATQVDGEHNASDNPEDARDAETLAAQANAAPSHDDGPDAAGTEMRAGQVNNEPSNDTDPGTSGAEKTVGKRMAEVEGEEERKRRRARQKEGLSDRRSESQALWFYVGKETHENAQVRLRRRGRVVVQRRRFGEAGHGDWR